MKTFLQKISAFAGTFLLATAASAQNFALNWFTLDSGGGTSTGGVFAVSGAITQPNAGAMNGGNFSVTGEFLTLMPAVAPPSTATASFIGPSPYLAFDNTLPGAGGAISPFAGMGFSYFHLETFEDQLLNTPGVSAIGGVVISGSGLLDSVDADDGAINGSGSGSSLFSGNGASGIRFNFDAAVLGALPTRVGIVWTDGAGDVTFQAFGPGDVLLGGIGPTNQPGIFPDNSSSGTTGEDRFFGVIHAGGISSILIKNSGGGIEVDHLQYGAATTIFANTPRLAADGSTVIPGGTGNFTGLPYAPSLSGNNLAFYGTGSGGQQGIYLTTRGIPTDPVRIADLKTPIPNGAGDFLSFGTDAGIIIVSGNNAVFAGTGSGGQRGIYAAVMVPPQVGSPLRIADTATAIPGGSGNFTEFPNTPSISGNNVAFAGNGTVGQRGVYAAVMVPPQVGSPLRIADTAMPIPNGSGNFTEFPNGPGISGNTAIFAGNGTGGQRGVYAAVMVPPQVGSPLRIADTAMPIPNGSGNFTEFPNRPGFSGANAIFAGKGSGSQQGIYGARLRALALQASALHAVGGQQSIDGAGIAMDGPPFMIADTATAIPGGTGNFTGFGEVSTTESDVAFLGTGASDQTGIYVLTGGQLRKVISVGEALQGKTITGLSLSRDGLSEDGAVAFQATFGDGSQGVYTIDAPTTTEGLRITAVSLTGTELRLSFLANSGQSYVIESRADLAAGAWAEVPGTTRIGSGAALQMILPITLPQQFYRVRIVP